jgi:uncharacterized protein YyaL (SSP411 family)
MELLGSSMALGAVSSAVLAETPKAAIAVQKLQWFKSLKAAHKLAIETDKPMLIVFGASWCGWCHKLERETLADQRLVAMIKRDFVPVHQDFDNDSKVAKILEVESLPCTVILSPQADLLQKSVGFADFKGFVKILQAAMAKQSEIRQVQNQEVAR